MQNVPRKVTPSAVVSDKDHGAILTIAVALSIVCILLFFCTRLLIRCPWRTLLGRDDALVGVATALGTLQASIMAHGVATGLGSKQLAVEDATQTVKLMYAGNMLFVATVYADKLSVVSFFSRLSSAPKALRACACLYAAAAMSAAASLLLVGLQTPGLPPWTAIMHENNLVRWIVVEVMSSSLEIAIVVFPVFLVKDLQTSGSTKATVVGWFALRLVLIPLGLCRLLGFARAIEHDQEQMYYIIVPEVLLQVQMSYGIVAATLPCLRIFLRSASPLFLEGRIYMEPTITNTATAGRSRFKMSNIRRNDDQQVMQLSGGVQQNVSKAVRAEEADKISMASDNARRGIFVRRTVDLAYD